MKLSAGYWAVLLLAVIVLAADGCKTTEVTGVHQVSGEVSLPGVKSIAVLPFDARVPGVGLELSEEISRQLHEAGHFTVVDRSHLDRVIQEKALSQSGLFEGSNSSQVGRLVNADAVVVGIVSGCETSEQSQYIPPQYNAKTGQQIGGGYTETQVVVTLSGTAKVVDTQTGEVRATIPLQARQVGGGQNNLAGTSVSGLRRACVHSVAGSVITKISPHTEPLVLKLDLGRGELKTALKPGIQFAKKHQWDRAALEFEAVAKKYPYSSAPVFNQAVIAHLKGDLAQAQTLTQKATKLLPGSLLAKSTWCDEQKYGDLSHSVSIALKDRERLEGQSIAPPNGSTKPNTAIVQVPDEKGSKPPKHGSEIELTGASKPPSFSPDQPEIELNGRPASEYADDRSWRKKVRVAVVIPEVVIRRQVPDPAAETVILKHLLDAGFKCVEQTSIARLRYNPQVAAAIKDAAGAAELARKLKVDVLVIGEAFSEAGPMLGTFHNYRSRVEIRAIHADSSEIVAVASSTGKSSDIGEFVAAKNALEDAAAKSAQQLIAELDDYQTTNDGLTAGQRARQTRSDTIVVDVEQSQVRLEASAASATLRRAARGTALKVLDRVAPWIQVQLADGTEGWVHESEVRPWTETPLPPVDHNDQ